MFRRIKKRLQIRNQKSLVRKLSRAAFLEKYPDRHMLGARTAQPLDHNIYICTVWYGGMKPSSRSWWKVDLSTRDVLELTKEQASQFIEIKIIR